MAKPQPSSLSTTEQRFVKLVWEHFRNYGRHDLPWRKTHDPYRILVSEIMLQQTQAPRVVGKYRLFLKAFPTAKRLAAAPLSEVLCMWQGLGYNRRAKFLHEAAKMVVREYGGKFPSTYETLRQLPGVGAYTASAVMVFAFNSPQVLIETNVRTVFIHHFFPDHTAVSDQEILAVVARTLPLGDARNWYAALMDYGTYLKRTVGNQNSKSTTYKKQTPFVGSVRQVRGAIVRTLVEHNKPLSLPGLEQALQQFQPVLVRQQLTLLVAEGLLAVTRGRYHLPLL